MSTVRLGHPHAEYTHGNKPGHNKLDQILHTLLITHGVTSQVVMLIRHHQLHEDHGIDDEGNRYSIHHINGGEDYTFTLVDGNWEYDY